MSKFVIATLVLCYAVTPVVAQYEFKNLGPDFIIWSLGLNPNDEGVLYAGTSNSGLYKSTNGGGSWSASSSGISDNRIVAIALNPTNPTILHLASKPVYRSGDGGATWTVGSGLPNALFLTVAVYSKNPDVLYSGTIFKSGINRVYKSTNGGDSWFSVDTDNEISDGNNIHALAVHPQSSKIVLVGTEKGAIYKTTDSGQNWDRTLNLSENHEIFRIRFDPADPSTVYAATFGSGIYKSTDVGENWFSVNNGLTGVSLLTAGLAFSDGRVFAGTDGGIFVSDDAGRNWTHIAESDTLDGAGQIAFSNTGSLYVTTQNGIWKGTPTQQRPDPPSDLVATASSARQVDLTWKHDGNNIDSFRLERRVGSGSYSHLTVLGANARNFSDTSVDSNTTYRYRIRAENSAGNSDYATSNDVNTPPTASPALFVQPTSLDFDSTRTSLSFDITNRGAETLSWSISDDQSWIEVNPTSGSTTVESDRVTVTVDRTGLNPGSYSGTVTVSSNGGTNTVAVSMVVPGQPPVVDHTPAIRAPVGQPITIMATVADIVQVVSVVLEHRKGGETQFVTEPMMNEGGDGWIGTIPGSGVTSRGLEYRIRATNINGIEGRQPNSTVNVHGVRVEIANLDKGTRQEAEQYDLVSLPIDANNKNLLSLLGIAPYDSSKVRIFDIDPFKPASDRSPYVERTNGGNLAPGKALFLILKDGVTLNSGSGTSVSTTQEFSVPLNENWTFVGNPFNFNLPLSKVLDDAGSVAGRIFEFNAAGANFQPLNSTSVLKPFKGYVLFSGSRGNTLSFDPTDASSSVPVAPAENYTWSINISARSETAGDLDNLAAVSSAARQEKDEFDYPEPPVIGNYVSLYFPHPEWNWLLSEFSSDVKPDNATGHVWDFEIRGNIDDKITISVDDLEDVPADLDIYLVDEALQITRDVRRTNWYTIASPREAQPRRLKLVVGNNEFVEERLAGFVILPGHFELDQNFPNPFNPSTTIRYGLPASETVTLRVFNLLGEEIATLLKNDAQTAGYHTVVWDGRDHNGKPVASGLYIYHLQAGRMTLSRKMAFIK